MVCSKCGYAISRGQSSCVYCGTKVDTSKTENSAPKRTTSAFAKQLKSSQPDTRVENASVATVKEEKQSVQKPAAAPTARPQIVAPYAFRPMYSPFDPNSEDSPFVRKPLNAEPDAEPDIEPETQQVQSASLISEEQPADKMTGDDQAAGDAVEEPRKKKHGLSIAALSLFFVVSVICLFINF